MKNYKIDFAHNTLILDKKFAKEAQTINSTAYAELKKILSDFPYLSTRVVSHRDVKGPHHNKNLTYSNMVEYIASFDNSENLLAEFALIKRRAVIEPHPYSVVRDWFMTQFPEYQRKRDPNFTPGESFKSVEADLTNKYATAF